MPPKHSRGEVRQPSKQHTYQLQSDVVVKTAQATTVCVWKNEQQCCYTSRFTVNFKIWKNLLLPEEAILKSFENNVWLKDCVRASKHDDGHELFHIHLFFCLCCTSCVCEQKHLHSFTSLPCFLWNQLHSILPFYPSFSPVQPASVSRWGFFQDNQCTATSINFCNAKIFVQIVSYNKSGYHLIHNASFKCG